MLANISYVLSLVATVLGLIEPFGKKMKTILTFNFIGNFLVGMSYLCVSGFSGMAVCFVACVQVLINYGFEVKGSKVPLWLIAVHAIVFVVVNLISFTAWYDILALLAALMFVLSVAQSSAKYYRALYLTNSLLWIGYDFLAGAYGNLFTHTALLIGISIAMFIRDRKEVKK